MNIRCVVFDEKHRDQLIKHGWIPEGLDIELDECCFFGGVDEENRLRAIAIFSYSRLYRRDIKLEYVYVNKKWRRKGIGSRLLRLAEKQLQLLEMRRIRCEWFDTKENMEILSACLKRAGFLPSMNQAHMLVFSPGDLQGGVLEKLKDERLIIWKNVIRVDDYHARNLRKFLAQYETTGFYIKERDFRPELCRFYLEDGEIKAAAGMRILKNGSLTLMTGYVSPALKYKNVTTFLIAALICDLRTVLRPGIKIYLKVYHNKIYESVKKILGEGQKEYILQEYERVIGEK